MFLLDTCVLSALSRSEKDLGVLKFIEETQENDLYISAITVGEVEYGIGILPEGKRKEGLRGWIRTTLDLFKKRIVPFHEDTASIWGEIRAEGQRAGRTFPVIDAQIAACAKSSGLTLVTRNVKDFEGMGIQILNPWNG